MSPARAALLADRLDLAQLVTDYAYAIDERAFERLDAVFTPDAWIDYTAMGGIAGRYPQARAWLPEALKHFPGYMHLIGNLSFEIEGDAAIGKVACFNPMVLPRADGEGSDTMFLGLWYLDRYVRTASGWRISERVERKSYDYNIPPALKAALEKR
ncbi:MAG: nuclear transport factor 2 family protein [Panacagrimonas sp.]|nr:nuclear transport factor 2 family protein [Panacagrimonas sp.]MCC2656925.1 nuclear transport factor 2 family protein [Panacagrimonas sp.]